jgi:hypothetical protein
VGDSLQEILARKKIRDEAAKTPKVVPQDDGSSVLDPLLDTGDYLRYGMGATDKFKELVKDPNYLAARDEADRTEALRRQSARMASSHLSSLPIPGNILAPLAPVAATGLREGLQGVGAFLTGKPFFTPGGLDAKDQTPEDMSPTSGFNLRSMGSAMQGAYEGSPVAQLLKALGK